MNKSKLKTKHENDRVAGRQRRQSRSVGKRVARPTVSGQIAHARPRGKKPAANGGADASVEVVAGSVWQSHGDSSRVRVTWATRVTVDLVNEATGKHRVMARAWFIKHHQEVRP